MPSNSSAKACTRNAQPLQAKLLAVLSYQKEHECEAETLLRQKPAPSTSKTHINLPTVDGSLFFYLHFDVGTGDADSLSATSTVNMTNTAFAGTELTVDGVECPKTRHIAG